MGISPTYKWGILGLQPIYKPFTNFLGHLSSHSIIIYDYRGTDIELLGRQHFQVVLVGSTADT